MRHSSEHDTQIGRLFDLQNFHANSKLAKIITDVENRYCNELSDNDLGLVCAAGENEVLYGEKNDENCEM